MSVPIEQVKPGTVWRFKGGVGTVIEVLLGQKTAHVIHENEQGRFTNTLIEFASHAIEQVKP